MEPNRFVQLMYKQQHIKAVQDINTTTAKQYCNVTKGKLQSYLVGVEI